MEKAKQSVPNWADAIPSEAVVPNRLLMSLVGTILFLFPRRSGAQVEFDKHLNVLDRNLQHSYLLNFVSSFS